MPIDVVVVGVFVDNAVGGDVVDVVVVVGVLVAARRR